MTRKPESCQLRFLRTLSHHHLKLVFWPLISEVATNVLSFLSLNWTKKHLWTRNLLWKTFLLITIKCDYFVKWATLFSFCCSQTGSVAQLCSLYEARVPLLVLPRHLDLSAVECGHILFWALTLLHILTHCFGNLLQCSDLKYYLCILKCMWTPLNSPYDMTPMLISHISTDSDNRQLTLHLPQMSSRSPFLNWFFAVFPCIR